jgi:hypothetical protein
MITKQCEYCGKDVVRYRSGFRFDHVFCSQKCASQQRIGENNKSWKGGRYTNYSGYTMIRVPGHPRTRKNGYVLEHIVVMETIIGRYLEKDECIHHINGDPADNRPDNLKLYKNNGEHHKTAHANRYSVCKCGRRMKGHGLCFRHLAQLKRTGKTWDFENLYLFGEFGDGKIYSVQKGKLCHCGKPVLCKGLCSHHYRKARLQKRKENKNI